MLNRDQKQRLISALGVMFSSSDFVFGEEFCRLAEAAGYEALLYWRSGGMLAPRFAHFKERYRWMAAGQIRQEHELCRLYALLEEHRLPFARKRPASSMVMVDRGEIFSKGEMATK